MWKMLSGLQFGQVNIEEFVTLKLYVDIYIYIYIWTYINNTYKIKVSSIKYTIQENIDQIFMAHFFLSADESALSTRTRFVVFVAS